MPHLEHFFYGQRSANGEQRVLAQSAGTTDAHIQDALNHALLPPSPELGSAWAIVRAGRGRPAYITVVASQDSGAIRRHIIALPVTHLKALAGNLSLVKMLLADADADDFADDALLDPLTLPDDPAPEQSAQVDALLNLMTFTGNNTRRIEPLLAAVVNGLPLIVQNAPAELTPRIDFVQGLLALLPASTRFGVTVALYNTPESPVQAQIAFLDGAPEREALVFDWESRETSGADDVSSDYSHFVIGQLRLDADLAMQQVDSLAQPAGWRVSEGDSLAQALDYASYRTKLDRSVENNLPVDVANVAEVLADDPTLSAELQARYARHLMALSLATNEPQHLAPIAKLMSEQPTLTDEMIEQLRSTTQDGDHALVFETLAQWMRTPHLPPDERWTKLLRVSALAELKAILADDDSVALREYLVTLQALGAPARPLVPTVLKRVFTAPDLAAEVAPQLVLLAAQHLSGKQQLSFLSSRRVIKPQPRPLQQLLVVLQRPQKTPPRQTLANAVKAYDDAQRNAALAHLARLAQQQNRLDLIDRHLLRDLVTLLKEGFAPADTDALAALAADLTESRLRDMQPPAHLLLLQLLLLTGHHTKLAAALTTQTNEYYGASKQATFMRDMQRVAQNIALDDAAAAATLDALADAEVPSTARLALTCGLLKAADWSPELEPHAFHALRDVALHPAQNIPLEPIFMLLNYYARQGDERKLRIAARVTASACARQERRTGVTAINRAYQRLKRQSRTRPIATALIQQYVREAPDDAARYIMRQYRDQLDERTAADLQTAYEFSNMLSRLSLPTYAQTLHAAVETLQSLAEAYSQAGNYPQLIQLRGMVERIRRENTQAEQSALGDDLRRVAHSLVILGEQHQRRSSSDEASLRSVTAGDDDPRSLLDVLRAAGGFLLERDVYPFAMRPDPAVAEPFGAVAAEDFAQRAADLRTIIHAATNSRPTSRKTWSQSAIADELESRRRSLLPEQRDELLPQLGRDWQRLADVVTRLIDTSDTAIIQSDNPDGQRLDEHKIQPQSPLALLRFTYGFFGT